MNKLRVLCTAFFLLTAAMVAQATHNRAGEITYRHIGGLSYEVTITTCTKTSSPADRDWLEINWGDNTGIDSVERTSIVPVGGGADAQVNTYVDTHQYAGPGIFTISMLDPNRNSGVLNIGNSVNVAFCIQSVLVISPFGGVNGEPAYNNSVQLLNPAKDNACINRKWLHNPGAVDIDGDSLVYSLVPCLGEQCLPIPVWTLPGATVGGGVMTINSATGDVCWDSPTLVGEYNIAILIEEYRSGILVGSVIRDMQITVAPCSNNPPVLDPLPDTCVKAGSSLSFLVTATDQDLNNMVIEGFGSPFIQNISPATLASTNSTPGSANANFQWNTDCDHVQLAPHTAYFKVTDIGGDVDLSDIINMNITVIAPAPENVVAVATGNSVSISWDPSICGNAVGYKIYRRSGLYNYVPAYCETGVPAYTGYVQIGSTTDINATSFIDNANLTVGQEYCYMIVACFPDGAESCASEEVCASLTLDLPIITHVSVDITDPAGGADTVRWLNPSELDTLQFAGPYEYVVFRGDGFSAPSTQVFATGQINDFYLLPNEYYDTNINTEDQANTYSILLLSGVDTVGYSLSASSILLGATPNDNQVGLTWTEIVPWTNDSFEVYREDPTGSNNWLLIGVTTEHSYVDTGLVNGANYCYYVRGFGSYAHQSLPSPLLNRSQIVCAEPVDLTPPCPPVLTIEEDCPNAFNTLTWTNPNNSCADDVMSYNVYYSETDTGQFEIIATIDLNTDTVLFHDNDGSIAGCYFVTALDTFNVELGYANESDSSNIVCIDNCPVYVLPNVFTPNSDNVNDFFIPFPYQYVESIDLQIYNRWGNVVFETTDPAINWDGTNQDSGEPLTDGVYYYLCTVNTIRLTGIEPVVLRGYIQLFNDAKPDFK